MRLGITIPLDGFQNRHFIELLRHAEKLGFADAWSYETAAGDAFTPVAAAATATEQMRLGTAIVPVFTRPAALIALSAAGLQHFSGGRFILGLGISTPTIVEQWMGIPYKLPITRLRETIGALRAMFSGQKVTITGKAVQINGFRLGMPPVVPPPIYIGAQGELMLQIAGELGDGIIVNYITPQTFPRMLDEIRKGALKAAKNLNSLDIACRILVAVDEEQDIVRENLRRELTAYLTVPQYNRFFRWIGYENEAQAALEAWNAGDRRKALSLVPDYMLESIFVFGTVQQIVRRLREYERAGITSTALQLTSFQADPEQKRQRIILAMEALAAAWSDLPA
jgi:probable F420-dependent oxidoreductase